MGEKQKVSLETTVEDFVKELGWKDKERRKNLRQTEKRMESRIYNELRITCYTDKTLAEFKDYTERLPQGLASFRNLGKKAISHLNNELIRHGIEPIIPKVGKMKKRYLGSVDHPLNYRLYGEDYLKYNGFTLKDIYKRGFN